MNVQWVGAGAFFVYLISVWAGTAAAGVIGPNYWIVSGTLTAMGISGYGIFMWLVQKRQQAAEKAQELQAPGVSGAAAAEAPGGDELAAVVKEAEQRLASSKSAAGAHLTGLPLIFIVGEQGSIKTSTMVNSGLEPELLAGHVYQDSTIVPTRGVNIWLAKQTLFVEAGGPVFANPDSWTKLIKRLAPGQMKSVMGGSGQAPRGALLCVDVESFMKPGASETMTVAARALNQRLGLISETLGISFPVYVLFTRVDRLPFFVEYFRNLERTEATQVFGATLPMRESAGGVYAEEETRRLTKAFGDVYYSLCDRRMDYLPRETEGDKLPGAYEFPREFRKLRAPLVQFLVDLGRPSQLRASPFLRGFYFSGVRPVFVTEAGGSLPQPARPGEKPFEGAVGATRMFRVGMEREVQQQVFQHAQVTGTRKVPQWCFIPRLFNDVILADSEALAASGSSVKTSMLQRALLSVAAFAGLVFAGLFTVSFFGNKSLEDANLKAAQELPAAPAFQDVAPLESLTKLETIRANLAELTKYRKDGRPFRLGMGLYVGDDLYPSVRCIWYNRFQQLLLAQVMAGMVAGMQKLPATPGPTDEYGPTYDTLKHYLILTTEKARSTPPVAQYLLGRWSQGREVAPEQSKLALAQFDFFAEDVKAAPACYSPSQDPGLVDRTRRYLAQFSGTESVYRFMLTEASRKSPPVNFNKKFPGSEQVVVNNRDVEGAFTRPGWDFMQGALKKASDYFGGEGWVLGQYKPASVDAAKLEKELTERYVNDFIRAWRQYLRNTTVVGYTDLSDAAKKLDTMASNTTPLLALFWLATANTAVDDPRVTEALQPVHHIVPPPATVVQYIWPSTNPYVQQLSALQRAVDGASQTPDDPSIAGKTRPAADAARGSVRDIARSFRIDLEGKTHEVVEKILTDPITQIDPLVNIGPRRLNAKGRALCGPFDQMTRKFPFNSTAVAEVTLQELNSLLRPKEGAVWKFYEQDLKDHLVRQGNQFVPKEGAPFPLNGAFIGFFNEVTRFSEALYSGGSADPKLVYTLSPLPSDQIQSMKLTIDGQSAQLFTNKPQPRQFTWPGTPAGLTFEYTLVGGGSPVSATPREGLWGVFRFFADADRFAESGDGYQLEWIVRGGRGDTPQMVGGKPLVYRFFLDTKGAPAVFKKEYLGRLKCVSQVAR